MIDPETLSPVPCPLISTYPCGLPPTTLGNSEVVIPEFQASCHCAQVLKGQVAQVKDDVLR